MICLGMFRVEEDKAVDNGYNRQITAYDFMQTFREMDIFNWYRHLFEGINKLDNDYLDATNETGEETKKPDNYDRPENWIRKPQKKWTIKAALVDLIDNLAAYDMIVYDENGDALVGCTNTNPSVYGRNYGEGNAYSGFGMPVMLDTDIITEGTKPYTPSDIGPNEYERYGYMNIMDLEFMQNPKVMNDGSLSMGKFLEDIGVLAGRYPFIRADRFDEDVWHDPSSRAKQENRYNNYERCILSFKPLPDARDDETSTGACKLQPDQIFDNHQIVKGFQHEQFTVQDVMQVKIGINDGTTVEFKRLNESQRAALKKGEALQTFTFSNNLFCSYLIDGSENDDDDTKSLVKEYKKIKKALFGKENTKGNMSSKALFNQGYMNIKYRNYVPFKLTTFADPVRDVGDRIRINFQDVVTGESTSFYTFILERTLEGIQKMMDTYSANGQLTNPTFSNYQTGTSYASGNKSKQMMLGYKKVGTGGHNSGGVISITPREMVEVMRNIGIRLLDEPITASAKFISGASSSSDYNLVYRNYEYPGCTVLHDGDTTNPINIYDDDTETVISYEANANDYVTNEDYTNYNEYYDSESELGSPNSLHIYNGNSWVYAGVGNCFNGSGTDKDNNVIKNMADIYDGSTVNVLQIAATTSGGDPCEVGQVDTIHKVYGVWAYYAAELYGYEYEDLGTLDSDIEVPVTYGTVINRGENPETEEYVYYTYIYPGIWKEGLWIEEYPDNTQVDISKHVELKWEDPDDIEDWEPTPARMWSGTVIVRKEDTPPLHRWDGVEIIDCREKNKYKDTPYIDEDIELNKVYYYGFFPYYPHGHYIDHITMFYRFTKVLRVDTSVNGMAPVITEIVVEDNEAGVYFTVPKPIYGDYTNVILYGKIGTEPECDETDDVIIENINYVEGYVFVGDLEPETEYYFALVTEQEG